MKKVLHLGLVVAVILLAGSLYEKVEGGNAYKSELKDDAIKDNTGLAHAKVLETKTKKFGAVSVDATLNVIAPKEVVVDLILNTHSVDLSYDFYKITILKDDKGREYKVVYWSGSTGGHHLEGELSFEELDDNANRLTLILMGIDEVTGSFSWEL